jgi:DNA-binding NarL/FixJ family response regulator
MTFAGIVACQVGTAFASRVERASSRAIGFASNPLLLWGVAFELAFAAALIHLPPLQSVFGTRALGLGDLLLPATFPPIVWSADELRRLRARRPAWQTPGTPGRQSRHGVVNPAQRGREQIKIVLADDHAMVRHGLRMVLDSEPGLAVVAEASDVEGALHRTRELRPAVVVLDLSMPGTPTISAIDRFLALAPGTAVVVLTMEADPSVARAALAAGARAYVLKEGAESALSRSAPRRPDAAISIRRSGRDSSTPPATRRCDQGRNSRATYAHDEVFRARFTRECRLAASLEHPNVVTVFHAGEEQGRLYVTMASSTGPTYGRCCAKAARSSRGARSA